MVNLIARNWCIFRKLGGGKKRIQIKDYAKKRKKKKKRKGNRKEESCSTTLVHRFWLGTFWHGKIWLVRNLGTGYKIAYNQNLGYKSRKEAISPLSLKFKSKKKIKAATHLKTTPAPAPAQPTKFTHSSTNADISAPATGGIAPLSVVCQAYSYRL